MKVFAILQLLVLAFAVVGFVAVYVAPTFAAAADKFVPGVLDRQLFADIYAAAECADSVGDGSVKAAAVAAAADDDGGDMRLNSEPDSDSDVEANPVTAAVMVMVNVKRMTETAVVAYDTNDATV